MNQSIRVKHGWVPSLGSMTTETGYGTTPNECRGGTTPNGCRVQGWKSNGDHPERVQGAGVEI